MAASTGLGALRACLCTSPSLATDVTLSGRFKLDSRWRLQVVNQIIHMEQQRDGDVGAQRFCLWVCMGSACAAGRM